MDVVHEEAPFKTLNITREGSAAVLDDHMMTVAPNGEGRVYSDARVPRDTSDEGRDNEYAARFNFNDTLEELVVAKDAYYPGEFNFSFEGNLEKLSAHGTVVERNPKGGLIVYTDASCKAQRTDLTFTDLRKQSSFYNGELRTIIGNALVEIGSQGDIVLHTNEPVITKTAAKAPNIKPGAHEFYANRVSIGMYGTRMETGWSDRTKLTLYTTSEDIGIAPARQPGDTMPDWHQFAGKIYLGTLDSRQGPLYIDPENTKPLPLEEAKNTARAQGGFVAGDYTTQQIGDRLERFDLKWLKREFGDSAMWIGSKSDDPSPRLSGLTQDPTTKRQECVDPETPHPSRVCYVETHPQFGLQGR